MSAEPNSVQSHLSDEHLDQMSKIGGEIVVFLKDKLSVDGKPPNAVDVMIASLACESVASYLRETAFSAIDAMVDVGAANV